MTTKIIKPAQYMIEQYDDAENLVNQEVFPGDTVEQVVADAASALEEANPDLKTIWFKVSEITEDIYLPGQIVETQVPDTATLYDIMGTSIPIASATRNGEQLEAQFYLADPQPGDLIEFFDIDGNLVAELTL